MLLLLPGSSVLSRGGGWSAGKGETAFLFLEGNVRSHDTAEAWHVARTVRSATLANPLGVDGERSKRPLLNTLDQSRWYKEASSVIVKTCIFCIFARRSGIGRGDPRNFDLVFSLSVSINCTRESGTSVTSLSLKESRLSPGNLIESPSKEPCR